MVRLTVVSLLFATFLLTGCATEAHGPRARTSLPLPAHTAVELRVVQQEVGVDEPRGNAQMYGGGLLGALINVAVSNNQTKKAEARSVAARDQLVGWSLVDATRKAVESGLDPEVFGAEPVLEVSSTPLQEDTRAHRLAVKPRVLVIEPSFHFTADFHALLVAFHVTLQRRELGKTDYLNTLLYPITLDGAAKDDRSRDERANAWAALGRDELVARIERALAGCVAMLNYDIGAYAEEKAALGPEIIGLHGVVMKHVGDRQWRRVVGNALVSEPEGTK